MSLLCQAVVNEGDSHRHITHRETKPSQDYKASLGGNVLLTKCVDIWRLYDWWLAAKKKKGWLVFIDQTVRVMKRRSEGSDSAKLDNVSLNVKSQECPKSRDGKKREEEATKGS